MKPQPEEYSQFKIFNLCRILEAKQSCELNPSKIESPTEACANAEFLLQVNSVADLLTVYLDGGVQVLDDITESIFMSSEACPRTLRYICACLQRDVQNRCRNIYWDFAWTLSPRWPQERLVKTRVVSGFIFLRLLCPAILNPRQV